MRVVLIINLLIWVGISGFGQEFYQIAEPDEFKAKLILGRWSINNGEAVFKYTDDYVCRVEGFKFYRYTTSRQPRGKTFIYTVLISRKNKKSYLSRGLWKDGRAYGFTTSLCYFMGDDKFVVMKKNRPREVFFEAVRLNEES